MLTIVLGLIAIYLAFPILVVAFTVLSGVFTLIGSLIEWIAGENCICPKEPYYEDSPMNLCVLLVRLRVGLVINARSNLRITESDQQKKLKTSPELIMLVEILIGLFAWCFIGYLMALWSEANGSDD